MEDECLALRWEEFPDLDHPLAPNADKCDVTLADITRRINFAMENAGVTRKMLAEFLGMSRDTLSDHINHRPDLMGAEEVAGLCQLTSRSRNYLRFGRLEHPNVPLVGKLFGVKIFSLLYPSPYGERRLTPDHLWILYSYLNDDNRDFITDAVRKVFEGQLSMEANDRDRKELLQLRIDRMEAEGLTPADGEPDWLELARTELALLEREEEVHREVNHVRFGEE